MLLFAHAGLTLGVFALIPKAIFDRLHPPRKSLTNADYKETDPLFAWAAAARRWQLDYRIVLLGSMFPDLVDKPLGILIFPHLLGSGRVFAHTLLVNAVLLLIGFLLIKKRPGFLIFALASCFHLVLDQMWLTPRTLLWPLYGWTFPPSPITHWWSRMFHALISNPTTYLPEILGIIILTIFLVRLLKHRALGRFLLYGTTRG